MIVGRPFSPDYLVFPAPVLMDVISRPWKLAPDASVDDGMFCFSVNEKDELECRTDEPGVTFSTFSPKAEELTIVGVAGHAKGQSSRSVCIGSQQVSYLENYSNRDRTGVELLTEVSIEVAPGFTKLCLAVERQVLPPESVYACLTKVQMNNYILQDATGPAAARLLESLNGMVSKLPYWLLEAENISLPLQDALPAKTVETWLAEYPANTVNQNPKVLDRVMLQYDGTELNLSWNVSSSMLFRLLFQTFVELCLDEKVPEELCFSHTGREVLVANVSQYSEQDLRGNVRYGHAILAFERSFLFVEMFGNVWRPHFPQLRKLHADVLRANSVFTEGDNPEDHGTYLFEMIPDPSE